jgi:TonB family protein
VFTLIFWFNPVLYFYKQALTSTHEFIADAEVTRTVNQQEYATLLVKQVFRQMDLSLGHYFNKSLTLKRMNMLQRNHLRPNRLKQALALPLIAMAFILVSAKNPTAAGEMEEPASANTEQPQNLVQPGTNRAVSPDPAPTPPQDRNKVATFPGGKPALKQYLAENLKYPAEALKSKMTGQAIIQVTIDKQGRLGNFKTLQADNAYFEQEALRVLKDMPAWQPASSNGKAETYTLAFPFIFGLESNKGLPALTLPANTTKFALQDATIVVGYSQVIPGKTVTQSSAAPSKEAKPATQYPRDSKIFTFVEQMAIFPGGEKAMNEFIRENLKYPAEALKNKTEGLVVAQFVVDRNGKISDPTIVKSLGSEFDEETLRLVKSFPDLVPAKQNGKPVELRYTLPIRFGLNPKSPATGNVPLTQNNPSSTGMIRLLKDSSPVTNCQPRLFRESQINTNKGQEKHLVTFHYRNPEGCPGETYQVEALRYSHMRGKRVIGWETETTGSTIDLVDLLKKAQPGDELYVTAKGKSAPGNGKAAVPFNAGVIIPLK